MLAVCCVSDLPVLSNAEDKPEDWSINRMVNAGLPAKAKTSKVLIMHPMKYFHEISKGKDEMCAMGSDLLAKCEAGGGCCEDGQCFYFIECSRPSEPKDSFVLSKSQANTAIAATPVPTPKSARSESWACSTGWFQSGDPHKTKHFCSKCPKGKFQRKSGQSHCNLCPAGKFSDAKAKYGELFGITSCLTCQHGGRFIFSKGCTSCPCISTMGVMGEATGAPRMALGHTSAGASGSGDWRLSASQRKMWRKTWKVKNPRRPVPQVDMVTKLAKAEATVQAGPVGNVTGLFL
jgi:hypothetical protein